MLTKQLIQNELLTVNGNLRVSKCISMGYEPKDVYLVFHNMEEPKCECGNPLRLINFNNGFHNYCSAQCPAVIEKRRQSVKNRSEESIQKGLEKERKTKLERYGDENYKNHDKAKETWKCKSVEEIEEHVRRNKQSKLERYGDENYNNSEQISKTLKERGIGFVFRDTMTDEELADHYKRIGEKVKKTKLERYGDENYNNSEQISKTRRENLSDIWDDWKLYKSLVTKYTRLTYLKYESEINPACLQRTLCGKDGFQLDHIISVKRGFMENIPVYVIAHRDNLQMLHWKDNRDKWF
jgi:hypothetical protein